MKHPAIWGHYTDYFYCLWSIIITPLRRTTIRKGPFHWRINTAMYTKYEYTHCSKEIITTMRNHYRNRLLLQGIEITESVDEGTM